jgi:predicted porin
MAALSGAAMAQSNVTISGLLDEFVAVHRSGGQNTYRLDSSGLAGSRLIFRGSEDLGSGLRANFFLENGFNADTGSQADATRFFNRQAWVGLSSATLGEMKFGRLTSHQFFMEGQFDVFQGATMGSSFNNLVQYTVRFDNAVGYTTPATLGPVKLHATYSLNEAATGRRMSAGMLAAEYKSGPLYLGANYADVQNAATLVNTKTAFAGGNYTFSNAKVFAGYSQNKASNGSVDRQVFGVSGQYSVTPALALAIGYARANDKTVTDADGSHVGIGFFYDLSKRTLLYGNVSKMNNSRTASYSLNGATALGVVPAVGNDVSGAQLGIRHLF